MLDLYTRSDLITSMTETDPFSDSRYTDEEMAAHAAWPKAALGLLEYTWSMEGGVHTLLVRAHGLGSGEGDRLCRLVQNLLIGRFSDLEAFPSLVEKATGLSSSESRKIAASIVTAILVPFNDLLHRWDQDMRDLYFELAR